MSSSWTLDVGGVTLTLTGSGAWLDRFARAWAPWTGERAGWEVRLSRDADLPSPDGSFRAARPRFDGRRCSLVAPGLVGEIAPGEERASLRAHPTAGLGDLVYFVRTAFALRAFDHGALLFHAAGIVHQGAAYTFFGRSGSGKSTAARLSAGKPVLSDDLVLLHPNGEGWEAWATPFGERQDPRVCSAPLRALLYLVQATEDRIEPMSPALALGELVACSPVVNADPTRMEALLTRCERMIVETAVAALEFRESDAFWEVIDAVLG